MRPSGAIERPRFAPSTFSSTMARRRKSNFASAALISLSPRGRAPPSHKRCGVRGNLTKPSATASPRLRPGAAELLLVGSLHLGRAEEVHGDPCILPTPPLGV